MQKSPLAIGASPPSFGWGPNDIYYNFATWDGLGAKPIPSGRGSGRPENTIRIQLSRYLQGAKIISNSAMKENVDIQSGKIDYGRWGKKKEYYSKPKKRHLMLEIRDGNGIVAHQPPKYYRDIHTAQQVALPNFEPSGIYNIASPQPKCGYGRFAELQKCLVYKLDNGLYWLELRRQGCSDQFEFRRIVFGNLDLANIPRYDKNKLNKSFWTMHRFGYGSRTTNQTYNKKFQLPHGKKKPAHFGLLTRWAARKRLLCRTLHLSGIVRSGASHFHLGV